MGSRNQLKSSSSPGKSRVENSCTENRRAVSLYPQLSLPQANSSACWEKVTSSRLLGEWRGREEGTASNGLAFCRAAGVAGFCLDWLGALMKLAEFRCRGATESKGGVGGWQEWCAAAPESLQCHRQASNISTQSKGTQLERKRRIKCGSNSPASQRAVEGPVSVSPDSGCWWGDSILWMPGDCWGQRGEWHLAAAAPENKPWTPQGARDDKHLKKKPAIRTGKLHAQAQRNYVLQKGFLRPPDSPASPTGEGLPCKKTERGGCFIKYIKLNNNHKIMRHKNKQKHSSIKRTKETNLQKPIPRTQKSMNYMTKNSN